MWGVQGHPEADQEIVSDWASTDVDTRELTDVDVPAVLAEIEAAGPAVEAAWRPVATAFAAVLRR